MADLKEDGAAGAGGPDRGAAPFVWAVLAAMVLLSLVSVRWYGSKTVPFNEDIDWAPAVTGDLPPFSAAWLRWVWEPLGEHRTALGKVVWAGVLKLAGGDYRSLMVLNVLLKAVAAAVMVLTARRLRGWTSYADAFFPLVLLNLADWVALVSAQAVTCYLYIVPAVGLLALIARSPDRLSPAGALLAGACILVLHTSIASGVLLGTAACVWLAYVGVRQWRAADPGRRRDGLVPLAVAAAGLALTVLLAADPNRSFLNRPPVNPRDVLKTAGQYLSNSLGPATEPFWQYAGLGLVAAVLVSACLPAAAWLRRPEERCRASGFLVFLACMLGLALAVGWGRQGWGGRQPHYIMVASPLLCAVYLIWQVYGGPTAARLVQMCLLAAAGVLFWPNWQAGGVVAAERRRVTLAVERDMAANMPLPALVAKHQVFIYVDGNGTFQYYDYVLDRFRMLKRAGVGPYRDLPDPAFETVTLPLTPAGVERATWDGSTARVTDENSHLTFTLGEPRFVYAVRLVGSYDPDASPASVLMRVGWDRGGRGGPDDAGRFERRLYLNDFRGSVMAAVNDTVDRIRVHPADKPAAFKLERVELLVPADSGGR